MNPSLPFLTSTWTIFLIFLVLLIVFDGVLVRWLQLGSIAWKRVDYIWLGFTALGLIGAVSQSRQMTAKNFLPLATEVKSWVFQSAKKYVSIYHGSPAICRTFTRTKFSPPPEEAARILGEYEHVCTWFDQLSSMFPQIEPSGEIPTSKFPPPPEVTLEDLKEIILGFSKNIESYNLQSKYVSSLRSRAESSDIENTFTFIWPLLLALALALRFTKVTGEIRLEHQAHAKANAQSQKIESVESDSALG